MNTFGRLDDRTTREERIARYEEFSKKVYVPIFSQPWWMNAICGDHWDVWLHNPSGTNLLAAMPYYFEMRDSYRYITKARLTQTNGIQFALDLGSKPTAIAEQQEKIINAAITFIESMHVDVYEQQYHYSFQNWQPFFWKHYTNVLRYTYVIENANNPEKIFNMISANYKNKIRKGKLHTHIQMNLDPYIFYEKHKAIFEKQNLPIPFTKELWLRLYTACITNNAGMILCAEDQDKNLHSLLFVVWDSRSMYLLLGGSMPEYSSSQSYPALVYESICMAGEMGLRYDFEGSMIKRIAHSFREYGGTPMPYYRIRKVFNPAIIRQEAEDYIRAVAAKED